MTNPEVPHPPSLRLVVPVVDDDEPDVIGDYVRAGWSIDPDGKWHSPPAEPTFGLPPVLVPKNGDAPATSTGASVVGLVGCDSATERCERSAFWANADDYLAWERAAVWVLWDHLALFELAIQSSSPW